MALSSFISLGNDYLEYDTDNQLKPEQCIRIRPPPSTNLINYDTQIKIISLLHQDIKYLKIKS